MHSVYKIPQINVICWPFRILIEVTHLECSKTNIKPNKKQIGICLTMCICVWCGHVCVAHGFLFKPFSQFTHIANVYLRALCLYINKYYMDRKMKGL